MPSRATLFRATALAILLLTGFELVACELLTPAACEIAVPQGDSGAAPSTDGDSCICCCSHIVVTPPLHFTPVITAVPARPPEILVSVSAEPLAVYHPPRV